MCCSFSNIVGQCGQWINREFVGPVLFQVAILDTKVIAIDYLKTWFVPDALASFPVDFAIAIAVK